MAPSGLRGVIRGEMSDGRYLTEWAATHGISLWLWCIRGNVRFVTMFDSDGTGRPSHHNRSCSDEGECHFSMVKSPLTFLKGGWNGDRSTKETTYDLVCLVGASQYGLHA